VEGAVEELAARYGLDLDANQVEGVGDGEDGSESDDEEEEEEEDQVQQRLLEDQSGDS
jgi:hypothetical protein